MNCSMPECVTLRRLEKIRETHKSLSYKKQGRARQFVRECTEITWREKKMIKIDKLEMTIQF